MNTLYLIINNLLEHMIQYIYISLQRNIDIDSANVIIKNMRPINTLEGFISRFGEELGKEKFELFKKRSITRSKELCSEYEIRSSSVWCKEFYMKRGYSEEESILLAKEFNKNNSGANKYFWENKGYSEDQINEIMKPINISKAYGKIQYKEKYGDDWINKWDQRIKKYRKTINALEFNDELELYYNECQKYTDHSITLYSDYLENFELRGRKYDYQLDHVYSIKQGFLDNISPKIIGHITNLRVIKSFDNSSKGSKCDKTLTELFEDVLKFNEINGNKK